MREQIRLRRESERFNAGRRSTVAERVEGIGRRADSLRNAGNDFRAAVDATRPIVDPAVEQTARSVRGVKRADVIETLTALTSTFGDVDQASLFLPIASKYRANMQALYGDQYGPADINRQISNTFKSLELLGVDRPTGPGGSFTDTDRERMESYFSRIAQATAATGGDINPLEFRAFAKYGRTAVMSLSPEGLQKLLPLVQQLGGSQTGTSLMSLSQNLIGARCRPTS